jgi:hypothetical protein
MRMPGDASDAPCPQQQVQLAIEEIDKRLSAEQ